MNKKGHSPEPSLRKYMDGGHKRLMICLPYYLIFQSELSGQLPVIIVHTRNCLTAKQQRVRINTKIESLHLVILRLCVPSRVIS